LNGILTTRNFFTRADEVLNDFSKSGLEISCLDNIV
jgi:hypothetical protein